MLIALCTPESLRPPATTVRKPFSLFASSPPVVDTGAAPVTMVWKYIGELVFNMLVLVGTIKASDRVVREMMGI